MLKCTRFPTKCQARAQRNFTVADRLREQLRSRGVTLDDKKEEWVGAAGAQGKYPKPSEAPQARAFPCEYGD